MPSSPKESKALDTINHNNYYTLFYCVLVLFCDIIFYADCFAVAFSSSVFKYGFPFFTSLGEKEGLYLSIKAVCALFA